MLLDKQKISWFQASLTLLGSLVLLFIIAPLISMFLATPAEDIGSAAMDPEVLSSIVLTFKAALYATIVSAFVGIPLAYLLARKRFPGRSLVLGIIDLPVIIPHSAAGIALFGLIGRNSLFGRFFDNGLIGTTAGISIAMAFVSIPFLINSARNAFLSVDPKFENVARTLGASPVRVFFTISLPLALRGIASGMILMWARGISEFGAVVIIAYHPMTTPVMVFQRFNDFGLKYARSVAVLLIVICVALFVGLRLFSSRLKHEGDANA